MTEYVSLGGPGDLETYIAATLGITSFSSQGGDGTARVTEGAALTISGIATATPAYFQPNYDETQPVPEAPLTAGYPVSVVARQVSADGSYGPATLLGTTTLVDSGAKDYNGREIYSWSVQDIDTSSLTAGVYDIEATSIFQTESGGEPAFELADHPAFSYLTVASAGTPALPQPQPVGGSAEISRDGRYLVASGSETDLQTGKVIALSSGETPPLGDFAPQPGLPYQYVNGQYTYIGISGGNQEAYDTYRFTSQNGLYTFGAIGQDQPYDIPLAIDDIDYNTNEGKYLREIYSGYPGFLYPVVTNNATGVTTLLPGYPGPDANGVPIAASDNGNVVLAQSVQLVTGVIGSISLSYLSAAPTLTIDPVDELPQYPGANPVTITGSSSAIGQSVEVDVAAVSSSTVASEYGSGQMIGLATVQDNGAWSFTFDPASLPVTPSAQGFFFEASVSSADGTPARTGENVSAELTPLAAPVFYNNVSQTTNQTSLEIDGSVDADEQGDTILIYDNFNGANTLVATTPAYNSFFDTTLTGLAEGEHVFTAVDEDPDGDLSAPSQAVTDIVDLTPPSEKVVGVTVNGGLPISLAQQKTGVPIAVHGELNQPLAVDDFVLVNAGDAQRIATISADGMSFDATIPDFGASGDVTVSVSDAAGNLSPTFTTSYDAVSLRTITRISANPADSDDSEGYAPVLSGDGGLVAFLGEDTSGSNQGAYVAQAATGKIVAFLPNAIESSLSANGAELSYVTSDETTGAREIFNVNLGDPSLTPVLVASVTEFVSLDAPRLSGDGSELVFESTAATLGGATVAPGGESNIFLAYDNGAGGYDVRAVTSDATGSAYAPVISEDGSTIAFESQATDLEGANPQGYVQTYVEALTGPDAGLITLVDNATTDGSVAIYGASNPSLSGDGRYVVFESESTNLAPANLGAGQTLDGDMQVYLKDLVTGRLTLVSINALGAPGDGASESPVISADGTKISFDSNATNLGSSDGGVFVADLTTGTLTVVSQPGGVAATGDDSSISADGSTVAFDSFSNTLVPDNVNHLQNVFVTSTAPQGQGQDGYIAGASVGYLDPTAPAGVVRIDAGEPQTTTSTAGDFSLAAATDPTAPLVLTGGVDSATGLAFNAYLEAPAGSTVVTALTTLIEKTMELTGDGRAAAETLVTVGLGLPAGVDLLNLDAFGGALGGDSGATAALQIGAQALNLVDLIVAAGGSATDAFNAIAAAIVAEPAGVTLSLTDAATVTSLAEAAHLTSALAQTIASLVAESAEALSNALASAGTPQAVVAAVTTDSIVEQGTAAADLARDGTGATNDFDGQSAFAAAAPQAQNNIANLETGSVACYVRGARITTPHGDVAIESLSVGDLVVTASGEPRPVVWIGHRRIDISRHPDPDAVRPVKITKGAFGPDLPRRDLSLSPGHNIASEGALMPISALVNDRSVAVADNASVEYWHVELDAHDVILAEGLQAESYLDTGNRNAFTNGGMFVEAHPDFAPKHWADTCLPLVKEGPLIAKTRARLLDRLAQKGYLITPDANARILVDGAPVEPIVVSQTRLAFLLPIGGQTIELRSNVFTPLHTVPENADSRTLGLCVGRLQIDGKDVALDDDKNCPSGWRNAEFVDGRFAHRWTTGVTTLSSGARIVIVDLAGAGFYWNKAEPAKPAIKPALRRAQSESYSILSKSGKFLVLSTSALAPSTARRSNGSASTKRLSPR